MHIDVFRVTIIFPRLHWGETSQSLSKYVMLRLRQNGRHFADDIFRCIFMNEKFCILIKIPLKFVPEGPIGNNPVLGQLMAWCKIGDKPLS